MKMEWSTPVLCIDPEDHWSYAFLDQWEWLMKEIGQYADDPKVQRAIDEVNLRFDKAPEPKTVDEANRIWRRLVIDVWRLLDLQRQRRL